MGSSKCDCSGAFRVSTSSVMPALVWLWKATFGRCALITTNDSHAQPFNGKLLVPQVHFDHVEVGVFGPQLHLGSIAHAFEPLHRYLVPNARHHNLSVAYLLRAVNGQQVAIQYARVLHAHSIYPQQVVSPWGEKIMGQAAVIFDVLLGQNRAARRHPSNQRNSLLRLGQTDSPGCAGNDFDGTFSGQGLDVLLRRVGGFETQNAGNFRTRGRVARFFGVGFDQLQHLFLSISEVVHLCPQYVSVFLYRYWDYIQCWLRCNFILLLRRVPLSGAVFFEAGKGAQSISVPGKKSASMRSNGSAQGGGGGFCSCHQRSSRLRSRALSVPTGDGMGTKGSRYQASNSKEPIAPSTYCISTLPSSSSMATTSNVCCSC